MELSHSNVNEVVCVHGPGCGHTGRDQGSCTFEIKKVLVRIDETRRDPASCEVENHALAMDAPAADGLAAHLSISPNG